MPNFIRKSITILWVSGLLATCSRPETSEAGTGLQIFAGAAKWNEELGKLKNPRGVLPNGTNISASGVMFRDPATSYEFFAYDDNVVLLLMSNSPVYFIKMETKDFQYHLKNELDQLRNGKFGVNKTYNTTTYFKPLGDYQVEVYFSPKEFYFTSSGTNKYRITNPNSMTYVDLWRLYESANDVTFYTPSFDDQKIADDFYSHFQSGKRRLILTDASTVTNPINYNLKSYGLNFSFMLGSNLTLTGNLLGCADLNNCSDKYFADPYWTTADFAAFISTPIGSSASGTTNYLSINDGIAVIVRGNITQFKDFFAGQGVNLGETPVTPTNVPAATLMFTEISPNITSSFDLIELKVTSAGSLNGIVVQANTSGATNFITFPDVRVAVGDIIVVHCNGATEAGAAPGNETTAKNQYPVGTYSANFDNAWDFQGSANGITATDTALLVCNGTCSASTVQDAVALSNKDGTGSGTFDGNLAGIQGYGAWSPANCGGAACTDATSPSSQSVSASMSGVGTTRTGVSVQRRNTGSYVDTNQSSDWITAAATFGADSAVTDGVAPTPGGGGAITANAVSFSQIDLSWTAGTDNITAQGSLTYDICQSTSSTGCNTFSATYSNGAGVVTKSVTGLNANTTYYFVVRVVDGSSNTATYTQTSATTPVNSDSTAPTAVSTLATGTITSTSIQLNWTAVGDDGNTGTATSYEMRYLSGASCPISAGNFATGTLVASMPTPQVAGSAETKTVTGLTASTSYCFALKVSDEVPNQSAISNVVTPTTSASCATAAAGEIVISEISTTGATASDEYVEIYNTAASCRDISGFLIRRETSGGTLSTYGTIPASTTMASHKYYLIGSGSVGVTLDLSVTAALANSNGGVAIFNGATRIDSVVYGTVTGEPGVWTEGAATFPGFTGTSGNALERKAITTSTAASMWTAGADVTAGNAFDANANSTDFIIQTNGKNPQNSSSAAEP